jgi:hypothetical protein
MFGAFLKRVSSALLRPWCAVVLVGAIVLPLMFVQRRAPVVAYCADCALRHETQSWQLWGAPGVTLFARHTETPTLASSALTQTQLVGMHTHRWVEPRVVRNPLNLYGPPVTLSLGFLNTPQVAAFLHNLGEFADPNTARNGLQLVLRPEYSYLVNHTLIFHKFPSRGFRDRTQFLNWWGQNAFSFYQHLREETEPD